MALGGIYETGTVTIAGDRVSVTGVGTLWTPVVEIGDWMFIGGQVGLIGAIVDDTHLTLESQWQGTLPAAAVYVIVKMSWLRYDPALTQAKVRELLEALHAQGTFIFVEGDEPDPAAGENGQWALKTDVVPWRIWYKTGGVWVEQAPAGFTWMGAWNSATTYTANLVVSRLGQSYISKTSNLNKPPESNPTDWDVMAASGAVAIGPSAVEPAMLNADDATERGLFRDRLNFVSRAGDTMTAALTLPADPTAALQAATKQYVDAGAAFDTKAAAIAASIPAPRATVNLTGYYIAGDGGGGLYKKVGANPTHNCKFQSADGAWWELAEPLPNLLQSGAKRDGVTDTAPYLNDLMKYVADILGGGGALYVPAGNYNIATTIVPRSFVRIICAEAAVFEVRTLAPFAQTAGVAVDRFWLDGGIFSAQTGFTAGIGIMLRTIKFSRFASVRIIGFTAGVGLKIEPDALTSTAYNVFDGIEINAATEGIQLVGRGPATPAIVTANHYTNVLLLGITVRGVNIVRYADNEYWSNLRIEMVADNAIGIDMNSDSVLAGSYGHIYGHDFDSLLIGAENVVVTGVIGVRLNASYQTNITPVSFGPDVFPGTRILDNAGMSQSHHIVISNMSADRRQYSMVKGIYNHSEGTSAIPVGASFIDIAHGLPNTPTKIQVMPNVLFPTPWVWSNVSGTHFRVQVGTAVTGVAASFGWVAEF